MGRLQNEDCQVEAISLHGGELDGVAVQSLDLRDSRSLQKWGENKAFDVVVHLAADIPERFSGQGSVVCLLNNTCIDQNLVEFTRRLSSYLVYASSVSVYGDVKGAPLTEQDKTQPNNPYSISKKGGEILCELQEKMGYKCSVLRISAPYGPGSSRKTVINTWLDCAMNSEDVIVYGSGQRTQDFVYIEDLFIAIWKCIEGQASGIFNIASGEPISMKDLATLVLEVFPESHSRLLLGIHPDPQDDYHACFSIQKARNILGWTPSTTLRDGLSLTAKARQKERS